MYLGEVVEHEVQRDRVTVVRGLLGKALVNRVNRPVVGQFG
jgi:3-methyladenine DNA glycosylase Mpg